MAVSPLNVATKGYLDSPLAVSVSGYLGGILPGIPEAFEGGVIVLANTYAALQSSISLGAETTSGLIKAEVLVNQYSVAMVPKLFSAIISGVRVAVDQLASRLGFATSAKEGAEVTKDKPGAE